jgi:DNA modification methylase
MVTIQTKLDVEKTCHLQYPDDFIDKIIVGDAFELIQCVPDRSIDIGITDPPYGLNKEGIPGDENLETYHKILPEYYRVLKPDSWFITFFSIKYLPLAFVKNPFTYFWQIILYIPSCESRTPIGINKYMSILVFKKGTPKIIHSNVDIFTKRVRCNRVEPDEWYIEHPTPKSKWMIMKILEMFSKEGDTVLDTFIGSGSTAVACKLMNRHFIGFEIEQKYANEAMKRLENIEKRKLLCEQA